jgi:hypothetical protein
VATWAARPEDLVLGFFGPGMKKCWDVMKPYFDVEGGVRGIRYLVFYEHLVCLHNDRDVAGRYRAVKLRRLDEPGRRTWLDAARRRLGPGNAKGLRFAEGRPAIRAIGPT